MKKNPILNIIVTVGFIGFLLLCCDCESMNSFYLSKLAGSILLGASILLFKLVKSYNQINTFNKTKSKNYESI